MRFIAGPCGDQYWVFWGDHYSVSFICTAEGVTAMLRGLHTRLCHAFLVKSYSPDGAHSQFRCQELVQCWRGFSFYWEQVISRIQGPLRPASVFSMWCDVMWYVNFDFGLLLFYGLWKLNWSCEYICIIHFCFKNGFLLVI